MRLLDEIGKLMLLLLLLLYILQENYKYILMFYRTKTYREARDKMSGFIYKKSASGNIKSRLITLFIGTPNGIAAELRSAGSDIAKVCRYKREYQQK